MNIIHVTHRAWPVIGGSDCGRLDGWLTIPISAGKFADVAGQDANAAQRLLYPLPPLDPWSAKKIGQISEKCVDDNCGQWVECD